MQKKTVALFLILSFFILGCSETEKVYLLPEREDVADALISKVMNDGAMAVDGLDDAIPQYKNYSSSSLAKCASQDTFTESYSQIKFGRTITSVYDTTIICDIHWDSAWVDLKYNLKGTFKTVLYDSSIVDSSILDITYIDTTWQEFVGISIDSSFIDSVWVYDTIPIIETHIDTIDSIISWDYRIAYTSVDSFSKTFTHETSQKALFLRDQNTDNPDKDWYIDMVTPMVLSEASESISIESILISSGGDPSTITLPGADTTMESYINRNPLPSLNVGSDVTVQIETYNTPESSCDSLELVLLHFGRQVNLDKKRNSISYSDASKKHIGTFHVDSHGEKVYRLFIDVIDKESILVRNGSYQSSIWMIPFRVP